MSETPSPSAARTGIVAAALDLFARQGFEATTVDQIAQAAGISRSTFFRQSGGKDDVVFADHELLLAQLRECRAADPELARRRYAVVRQVPALREREIVTVFRYERLFDEYLRRALPGLDPLDAVGFAALVTAVHNHVLRQLLRSPKRVPVSVLRKALDQARDRFGVGTASAPAADDIVVAVFPRRMPPAEIARRLQDELD